MKQEANPTMIVVAAVLILAIIGFIGYKFFGPPDHGDAAAMKKKYTGSDGSTQHAASSSNPPPGVAPANHGYPGMRGPGSSYGAPTGSQSRHP